MEIHPIGPRDRDVKPVERPAFRRIERDREDDDPADEQEQARERRGPRKRRPPDPPPDAGPGHIDVRV